MSFNLTTLKPCSVYIKLTSIFSQQPWSMDSNLVHCRYDNANVLLLVSRMVIADMAQPSYEAGALENVDYTPPKELWTQTIDPEDAPDKPYHFTLFFEKGVPVKIITEDKKEVTDSLELFKLLNKIGHDHGVGRIDIVENRFSRWTLLVIIISY